MKRIDRLQQIASLILDARLAEVQVAERARQESLSHLQALRVPQQGVEDVASAQVALRYEQWADMRRGQINMTLARQTVTWMEAQDRARDAFGRAEALRKLNEK